MEVISANLAMFLIKDTMCRSRRSCTALRVKAIISAGGHGTKDSKTLSEPNEEVAVSSDRFYAYLLLPLLRGSVLLKGNAYRASGGCFDPRNDDGGNVHRLSFPLRSPWLLRHVLV